MKTSIYILGFLILGLNGMFSQNHPELNIEFMKIDSLQYQRYKEDYANKLYLDSTKKTIPDSSFTLTINGENQIFNCEKDYNPCYYYKGFLSPINSFVVTHCTMDICETYLIDKTTGEQRTLFSPFDNECEIPVFSKDLNKMLVYASNVFDSDSFISIYQRTDNTENFNFDSFKIYDTNKWKIYEGIWIDETNFALKTFQKFGGKTGSEPLNINYIRGKIK
jgi:hypothetical protein